MKKKLNVDSAWFKNKNVRPKTFICHMEYSPGGFRVKRAYVENNINQHTKEFERVNIRDMHRALVNGEIVVN